MKWNWEGHRKPIHEVRAGSGRSFVEEQYKKDKGTQYLRLFFGGSAGSGIKLSKVKSKELLMLFGIKVKMNLDFVELQATDSGYKLYKCIGFEDVNSKYHHMKYFLSQS